MKLLNVSAICSIDGDMRLSELGVSYVRVATGIRRGKWPFEDMFQLSETLYCAVAQGLGQSDFVLCFFWAPTLDNVLISAYGLFSNRSLTFARPPSELLLGAPENNVMQAITQRNLPHVEKPVARKHPGEIAYGGLCLCADKFDFYFVSDPEEWRENKVWARERLCAIGIRTSNHRWRL